VPIGALDIRLQKGGVSRFFGENQFLNFCFNARALYNNLYPIPCTVLINGCSGFEFIFFAKVFDMGIDGALIRFGVFTFGRGQ
jgi:hypothetical protein